MEEELDNFDDEAMFSADDDVAFTDSDGDDWQDLSGFQPDETHDRFTGYGELNDFVLLD